MSSVPVPLTDKPMPQKVAVPSPVDYTDASDQAKRFGTVQPSRLELTLLDPDWQKVKDFEYVVWGGDKYLRRSHQVDALGSLDIHTVHCVAEDEA